MEEWQKNHIRKNFDKLIDLTLCSPLFLAKLHADGQLSGEEVDILTKSGVHNSKTEQSMKFYQIIQGRTNSYDLLKQALSETSQNGAYNILNILNPPNGENKFVKRCGSLTYDKSKLLGEGCNNTKVYKGKLENREVAIKVVNIRDINKDLATTEIGCLTKLDWHENVVRYFKSEATGKHVLIALELCDTDLHEWVLKKPSQRRIHMDVEDIIYQATRGILHLHQNRVIHRDLKPANILLVRQATGTVRVKISDFGLARQLPDGRSRMSVHLSGIGTEGWMAPEVMAEQDRRLLANDSNPINDMGFASDVFSLGCVHYYVLTNGLHPFGYGYRGLANIMEGRPELNQDKITTVETDQAAHYISLIGQMVTHDQYQRPSVSDLLGQLSKIDNVQSLHRDSFVHPHCNEPEPNIEPITVVPDRSPVEREEALLGLGNNGEEQPSTSQSKSLFSAMAQGFIQLANRPYVSKQDESSPDRVKGKSSQIKGPQSKNPERNEISVEEAASCETNLPETGVTSSENQTKLKDQPALSLPELRSKNQTKSWYTLEGAIKARDMNAVVAVIKQGVDVNARNDRLETPLHFAAVSNDKDFSLKVIKYLIDRNANTLPRDIDSYSFLDRLLDDGTTITPIQFHDMAEYLISKNLSRLFNAAGSFKDGSVTLWPHSQNSSSTFQMAAKNIEIEAATLALLQKSGVYFNHSNKPGHSVLFYAVLGKRSVKMVTDLVDLGADPKQLSANGSSLLHLAALCGNADIVEYFQSLGLLDINLTNSEGNTPLHISVSKKNEHVLRMVKFLTSSGANIRIKNNAGLTPLHLVSKWNHGNMEAAIEGTDEDAVTILVLLGATVTGTNNMMATPLHMAASSRNTNFALKIIKLLIDHKANPYAKDNADFTVLHKFVDDGTTLAPSQFHDMVLFLVSNGLSKLSNITGNFRKQINHKWGGFSSYRQSTPFQLAVKNLEIGTSTLSLLKENGVNFNTENDQGDSVLFYAIIGRRNSRLLSDLLTFGANPRHINLNGNAGCTLLHLAAKFGNLEHLQFFLSFDMDIDALSYDGWTPLHFLVLYSTEGTFEKVTVLVEHGANCKLKDKSGRTPLDIVHGHNNIQDKTKITALLRANS